MSKRQTKGHATRNGLPSITTFDLARIQSVIDTAFERDREVADALDSELSRAVIVDPSEVAPNVVTMNSRVEYESVSTGDAREVTLVYPTHSNAAGGRISVLAPLGAALLGLSVGDEIRWPVSADKQLHVKVRRMLYQPEAAGDDKS